MFPWPLSDNCWIFFILSNWRGFSSYPCALCFSPDTSSVSLIKLFVLQIVCRVDLGECHFFMFFLQTTDNENVIWWPLNPFAFPPSASPLFYPPQTPKNTVKNLQAFSFYFLFWPSLKFFLSVFLLTLCIREDTWRYTLYCHHYCW